MALPKQIKIGPVGYKVIEKDDLHFVDGDGKKSGLHGHILWSEAEIRVAGDQSEQVKVVTVWHEVIHGILNNAGINDHPEQVVLALGFGIVQLIRDNPDLIRATICEVKAE